MVELSLIMLKRLLFTQAIEKIQASKALIIYGPRRVGKTVLLRQMIDALTQEKKVSKYVHGETALVADVFGSQNPDRMHAFLEGAKVFFLDEAQQIPNIGSGIKLLLDTHPDIAVVLSGSASFDLAQKVGEPLTGRKKTLRLFPISAQELVHQNSRDAFLSTYIQHCIYGGYPELFSLPKETEKQEYLEELVNAYLFKDILELEQVKGAKKLRDLLLLLAFQIGHEVSLSELGNQLDLHKDTVARYLDLFEKSFVLINVRGFARNLRKEVSKSSRYYFWDNGVRNALIRNFNPPNLRNDMGMLWDNYLAIERIKKQAYGQEVANYYFWRTYDQMEIDWIEEKAGHLDGFEFKWGNKLPKPPSDWQDTYPESTYSVVNQENFEEFIL